MKNHVDYIFAGGPLHGQLISAPHFDGLQGTAPSCANDPIAHSPPLFESYRHANGESLRVAAKHRRGAGRTTRYIVLHPQATGEQFLTIFAS